MEPQHPEGRVSFLPPPRELLRTSQSYEPSHMVVDNEVPLPNNGRQDEHGSHSNGNKLPSISQMQSFAVKSTISDENLRHRLSDMSVSSPFRFTPSSPPPPPQPAATTRIDYHRAGEHRSPSPDTFYRRHSIAAHPLSHPTEKIPHSSSSSSNTAIDPLSAPSSPPLPTFHAAPPSAGYHSHHSHHHQQPQQVDHYQRHNGVVGSEQHLRHLHRMRQNRPHPYAPDSSSATTSAIMSPSTSGGAPLPHRRRSILMEEASPVGRRASMPLVSPRVPADDTAPLKQFRSVAEIHNNNAQPHDDDDEMDNEDDDMMGASLRRGSVESQHSRSPELRLSHKLAERKRRKEMKELFDELRDALPTEKNLKTSKWEILSKAIEYITLLRRRDYDLENEIIILRQELALLKRQEQGSV